MFTFANKDDAIAFIQQLESDIQTLAKEKSLATLEHKLNQRQSALEVLFSQFMDDIDQQDLTFLKQIQKSSGDLITDMQNSKHQKTQEIIKYKNTGKRIRLYTNIAQQK